MGILGFMGAGAGYQAQNLGIINFELIRHFFPSWAVLPFLFMIVSGLLSTVDSNLCAVSSLTTDIAGGKDIRKTRAAMAVLLITGILIANIPGITVTHLFLFYGTLRASTLLPTVMTLKGVRLNAKGIITGVVAALAVGLPVFAYGSVLNSGPYKTLGSLLTVLLSGLIASLVLGEICEKSGIDQSVLVRCNLEYPAFIAWIEQNKPSGLEVINTGQDMEWLKKHPDMLFPDKSNKAAQWFHIVQHRGQARYYKEHQLEILLLGRRKADGNYVGKDNIYTNSAGITRYSPLAEWRHEDILAYIHYYDVKLPPIYDWEKGYLCGTHPWPARQYMETEQQGWKEVYDIDKTIVENAAQHFDGARDFLKAIK